MTGMPQIGTMVLALALISPWAHAENQLEARLSAAETSSAKPQGDDKPKKQPPPPLFPKHRRGLYKNAQGVEVIDATPQSPPLETDDPGVPDKGEVELNLTTDADLAGEDRLF